MKTVIVLVLAICLAVSAAACTDEPRADSTATPEIEVTVTEAAAGTPALEIDDPYGARQLVVSGSRPLPVDLELYAQATCYPLPECNHVTFAIERISRTDGGPTVRETLFESGRDVESPPYVFFVAFMPDASKIALSMCTGGVCGDPGMRDAEVEFRFSSDFGENWTSMEWAEGWAAAMGFDAARTPLISSYSSLIRSLAGDEHPAPATEGVRGFPWALRSGDLVWATYGGTLTHEDGSVWLDLGLRGDEPLLAIVRDVVPSPNGELYAVTWGEAPDPQGTRRPIPYVTIANAAGEVLRHFRHDEGVTAVAWADNETLVAEVRAMTADGTPSGQPRLWPLPATVDALTGETWLIEGPWVDPPNGVQPSRTWHRVRAAHRIADCPITIGNGRRPARETESPNYHGNDAIQTVLWPAGIVRFDHGGPGEIGEDGSLEMKWPWWRASAGEPLTIEGRRLDAPAPPLEAHIPAGYEDGAFQATGLRFSSAGCWEVTARTSQGELTFVTFVVGPDGY